MIADYHKNGEKGFTVVKPRPGRPSSINGNVFSFIREEIQQNNLVQAPTTLPMLVDKLKAHNIVDVTRTTLWRALHRIGYRFVGRTRLIESADALASRSRFLRARYDNRNPVTKLPIKTEIVVGECMSGLTGIKSSGLIDAVTATASKESGGFELKCYLIGAAAFRSSSAPLSQPTGDWVHGSVITVPFSGRIKKGKPVKHKLDDDDDDDDSELFFYTAATSIILMMMMMMMSIY